MTALHRRVRTIIGIRQRKPYPFAVKQLPIGERILRNEDGVARPMQASRNYKKVVVDHSISEYLAEFSAHAGNLVGRPLEVSGTITDPAVYQANLAKLLG
jgi:hypothetical protein